MYYHSIPLDCWLLPVGPTFKHAWAAAFFRSRRAVTSRAAICQERVSSTAARVFESCCPERRNEQGHASSTAVRATGMQRGVANAGSTAERSSSLLLSATLPKCRRRNPACACLRMVSGNVTSTGTLRNSRLMLSSSRYGGQKSGCRSNGKHSPRVRRNNDCGKRKSCWKNRPNTRVSSWSGRFAVAREWLKSEPKCKSRSCDGQRMPSRAWSKRLPKWSSQSAAGRRTSCKGLLNAMPKVQRCHLNMPTWAICRDRVAKRKRITHNGYINCSSKTKSRRPRKKTRILKHFLNIRNFQTANCNAIYDSQLPNTIVSWTQPQQRGTLTQPFHCDLERPSCETQKNYAQRLKRLHKLQLQNRISTPKRENDDFEALSKRIF